MRFDRARAFLLAAAAALASSCRSVERRRAAPAPTPAQKYARCVRAVRAAGNSEHDSLLLITGCARIRQMDEQEIRDRRALVSPPAPGFRPSSSRAKIRLTLSVAKARIRAGTSPRFRLRMTNVGARTLYYSSSDGAFFRRGGSPHDLTFYLVPPRGPERVLRLSAPAGRARAPGEPGLSIHLRPGETLRTRGDAPGDPFRTLDAPGAFKTPGTYRLRAVFDDVPPELERKALTELERSGASRQKLLQDRRNAAAFSLGRSESNTVTVEVAP